MASYQSSGSAVTMPPFEDLFDDIPSPLRIPPLKSMFPNSTPDRPITLEPSTWLGMDNETSRLTSRQIALAQAKTMDALRPSELDAINLNAYEYEQLQINPLEEHNRKKRKLAHHEQLADFVHLPKPRPKLEEVNKKPFRPIAVLNQLNEPPPSAALFPPITPSQEEHERQDSDRVDARSEWDSGNSDEASEKSRQRKVGNSAKPKRNYNRGPRRKWTESETEHLKEGIALCGLGRWKDILQHPKLHFQEGRTHVDLKDKFRTLYPQNHSEKWPEQLSEKRNGRKAAQRVRRRPLLGVRAPYRGWTDEEDIELDKGFKKYGFQWQLMAQDESLQFDKRSAHQIRDRFRRRHPEKYQEQPPASEFRQSKERDHTTPDAWNKDIAYKMRASPQKSNDQTQPGLSSNKGSGRRNIDDQNKVAQSKGTTAPTFPSGLLNEEGYDGESEFTRSLAALDDDLKLPPLQWDDMAVQPIFDLG